MSLRILCAGFLCLGLGMPSFTPMPAVAEEFDRAFAHFVQPGHKREHMLAVGLREFDRLDIDQNGLTLADAEAAKQRTLARKRAQKLAELIAYDLDSDSRVTRAELETRKRHPRNSQNCNCGPDGQPLRNELAAVTDRWLEKQMQLDTNGDGALSMDEILAPANTEEADRNETRALKSIQALMSFDVDKNSTVSEIEFKNGLSTVFAAADVDHNGVIDIDEYEAIQR
jgi:hypothetical protein